MPSQLKQLKAELSKAGLARQSQPGSSKKRKRAGTVEQDRDKQQAKLQNIHDRFNQFDTKVTKLKHDVIGRKLKGVTGKPTMSKQAGIELRKKTLLVEHSQRHHVGGVVDRRFGEDDPDMTPEERMQERFTKERQRAAKLNAFALDDDEELTHYGQSLSKMDDFDATGLTLDDDEADATIDRATVARDHFGGFEEDEEDLDSDGEPRKKTKAEVMAEVIAKSKEHKYLRQQNQEKQESERMQLDDEFDSIRALLGGAPADSFKPQVTNTDTDKDYDQLVRDLFFDKRSKPSDRTKTEDELAVEEKTKLEKLERARLRRMRGDVEGSEDEDEAGRHKKRRRREKGGDDLEDDFMDEDEVDALNGLGAGLAELADASGINDAAGSEEDDEADGSGDDDDDGSGDSSDGSGAAEEDSGDEAVAGPSTKRPKKSAPTPKELPYTFPCPASHEELLDILENVGDANVPTVIQRIRTLYHPSLGVDNTAKLQTFCGVLVDHILYAASPPEPNLALVHAILPHVTQLSQKYPMSAAEAFVAKLKLMNKNLNRGLSNGPTSPDSKTWPGTAELMLLRTVGTIWSTSDKTHVVVGPARLLIASYLGLARVRSLVDIASGLFLCTLVLQYEHLAQRFVPEVVNFLFNAVLHLAPHSIRESEKVPGSFPCPDFMAEHCPSLRLGKKAKSCEVGKPDFVGLLAEEGDIEQKKVDLLACALDLLTRFAEVYKGLDGFVELFTPLSELLAAVQTKHYSTSLKTLHDALVDRITRLLKFSLQARRPLRLQAHKAIAIPTYIPKFTTTGGSSYLRAQDPDRERAEASKLRRQYKEERKGAIKELRKDAKFMAGVVHQQQEEKDRAYKDRMKRVHSSLEGERAEEKAMEREKSRGKKRSGGKK